MFVIIDERQQPIMFNLFFIIIWFIYMCMSIGYSIPQRIENEMNLGTLLFWSLGFASLCQFEWNDCQLIMSNI